MYRILALLLFVLTAALLPGSASARPASSQFTVVARMLKSGEDKEVILQVHTRIGAVCHVTETDLQTHSSTPIGVDHRMGPTGIYEWGWVEPNRPDGATVTIRCTWKGQTAISTVPVASVQPVYIPPTPIPVPTATQLPAFSVTLNLIPARGGFTVLVHTRAGASCDGSGGAPGIYKGITYFSTVQVGGAGLLKFYVPAQNTFGGILVNILCSWQGQERAGQFTTYPTPKQEHDEHIYNAWANGLTTASDTQINAHPEQYIGAKVSFDCPEPALIGADNKRPGNMLYNCPFDYVISVPPSIHIQAEKKIPYVSSTGFPKVLGIVAGSYKLPGPNGMNALVAVAYIYDSSTDLLE